MNDTPPNLAPVPTSLKTISAHDQEQSIAELEKLLVEARAGHLQSFMYGAVLAAKDGRREQLQNYRYWIHGAMFSSDIAMLVSIFGFALHKMHDTKFPGPLDPAA